MTGGALRAQEQARETRVKPEAAARARITPWVELNAPDTETASRPGVSRREHVLEGLRVWADVTDIAIVTSRESQIQNVYPDLVARKPKSLHLIGGLKTAGMFPKGFHDADAWTRIASRCREISRITGTNVIVLENETALEKFHLEEEDIDLASLPLGLQALNQTALEIWWYTPVILFNTPKCPNRNARTRALSQTVMSASRGSRFLSGCKPLASDPLEALYLQVGRDMRELVGAERIIDLVYVHANVDRSTTKRFYAPEEGWNLLETCTSPLLVYYPGEADWVKVAEATRTLARSSRPATLDPVPPRP